jgi:hypothetical protein
MPLPWTNKAANEQFALSAKQEPRGVAGKKLSPEEIARLKANLAKPVITKKADNVAPGKGAAAGDKEAPAKKGFFGLF